MGVSGGDIPGAYSRYSFLIFMDGVSLPQLVFLWEVVMTWTPLAIVGVGAIAAVAVTAIDAYRKGHGWYAAVMAFSALMIILNVIQDLTKH